MEEDNGPFIRVGEAPALRASDRPSFLWQMNPETYPTSIATAKDQQLDGGEAAFDFGYLDFCRRGRSRLCGSRAQSSQASNNRGIFVRWISVVKGWS
jgi:hypothetical protein